MRGSKGRFPFHKGKHLIVKVLELQVYADESGIHEGAPDGTHLSAVWCLVTGFIGSPRQWTRFDQDWQAVLDEYGVPDFHAVQFFARKEKGSSSNNPYRGWSDQKAITYLEKLLATVHNRRLSPIGGALHVPSFRELPYGHRKQLTGGIVRTTSKGQHKWLTTGAPNKPYFSVFNFLLVEAMRQAKDGSKVNFIFDRQDQMEGKAKLTFSEIAKLLAPFDHRNDRLGMVSFDKRKNHPGLQVADLHTHVWYCKLTVGEAMSTERQYALGALARKRNSMKILDMRGLEILIDSTPPFQRAFIEATEPPTKSKRS